MNRIKPLAPRVSALLRKKPFPAPSPVPPLPPGILVDEEMSPIYNPKNFYPVKPGEVLADRYQTLVKVGWGVSSTVWLARDLEGHDEEPERIVTLKIVNNSNSADHERDIEEHISTVEPLHRGRSLIRTLLESFEVKGPEGSYSCLVYPPMREPFSVYQRRFKDRKIPLPLIKTYIRTLLTALDYLHKECRLVHTDLKLENIMLSVEDPVILGDFIQSQLAKPMAFKIDSTGRPVYKSRDDFGPLQSLSSIPQLVDFGVATRLDEDDDWGIWPIQPDQYRAPEVIMGNGWQIQADVWNFGVLMWDMIEGKELFQPIHDKEGRYDAKLHIAEIIALLGPPPPDIIQRYHSMRNGRTLSYEKTEVHARLRMSTSAGRSLTRKNILGRFLYEDLIPDRKLGDTISFLEGEEKESFLDLAKDMLVWHPNFRKPAGEMAEHAFLQQK